MFRSEVRHLEVPHTAIVTVRLSTLLLTYLLTYSLWHFVDALSEAAAKLRLGP